MRRRRAFQFHTGSIKSFQYGVINPKTLCFNSILVRLKDDHHTDQYLYNEGFNSILVRLKVISTCY